MTTETSAELKLFRDTNSEFVTDRASVPATRALRKEGRSFDRDWWVEAAELGWTSLLVPEDLGGGSASGEGVVDLASVAELLGAHVSPGPLNVVSSVIAGLVHHAAVPQTDLLEGLMTGERIASWAVQGPQWAWRPLEPGVTARPEGDGWVLDGTARAVEFGAESDVLAVVATTPTGVIEVLVDTTADGITATPTGSVDFVRSFADVEFSGVAVGRDALVADESSAPAIIARQADVMQTLQVAEAIGAIGRVFEFTLQWGFDRYSFGRPLVSYQALKHRYADDFTWFQASQAITRAAIRDVQADAPHAWRSVSAAKSYVGDRGVEIVQDCGQMHGGLSQTMDHDINVYLRRVMLARQLYGTPQEHRARIADAIFEEEAA